MTRPVRRWLLVVPALAIACDATNPKEREQRVTRETPAHAVDGTQLLAALIDLDWLATSPPAGEKCVQFSSYDRASEKGRADPEAWYANGDCGVFLRQEQHGEQGERSEWVMADVDGPGAVVRIWSANPSGDLRFYVDGGDVPAFTIPFRDLCGGTKAPFVEPLCGVHSSGWNCYVPFPFARHLKLTASTHDFYYHVNVRRFAAGTAVASFTAADLEAPALASFAAQLDGATRPPVARAEADPATRPILSTRLEAGRVSDLELPGPATVRWFAARVTADDERAALRELRLEITFDGAARPSVVAPLGDFFGTAPDFTSYATAVAGVRADGTGWCRLPMPFARNVRVHVVNDGDVAVGLTLAAAVEPGRTVAPLRLHAKWRQARDLKTRPRSDYMVVDADGPGRFVGCSLSVRNPVKAWWGEGDEHAWVDGEKFPSTFGTGSEDYFGYAWCDPHPFQAAFHSQSRCDGPANRGYTSVNRFQLGDAIPFEHDLKFELEVWHWADCEVDYATMAYWYAPLDAADRFEPIAAASARRPRPVAPIVGKFPDALEAEQLMANAKTSGGKLQVQDMSGFGDAWSRDEQLWWTDGKPGDRLDLPFDVAAAGSYALHAQFTKAADYGVFAVTLDGAPLGTREGAVTTDGSVDLYHAGVVATGDVVLGTAQLSAGAHTLTFTLRESNPAAIAAHMVGIDYLRLVK